MSGKNTAIVTNDEGHEHEGHAQHNNYDGISILSNIYARLAFHIPTQTYVLIASKNSSDLRGNSAQNDSIKLTEDALKKGYIISAYRSSDPDKFTDFYKLKRQIHNDIANFDRNIGERAHRHFTLYSSRINGNEIYTNGRLIYMLTKINNRFKVTFYAPSTHDADEFVPSTLNANSLQRAFGEVSSTIVKTKDYQEARQKMAEHWQKMSSKLWEQENIYAQEGYSINFKKFMAHIRHHVYTHGLQTSAITASVGVLMGLFNPKYTLITGVLGAVLHTALHEFLHGGYHAYHKTTERIKKAKKRLNIEAYEFYRDVSDHFKIQTRGNITKIAPKIDLDRFQPEDLIFLPNHKANMLNDHQKEAPSFRPDSLRSHILTAHQRGYSSICTFPDDNTRIDTFQSGLVRFMHRLENGNTLIFARYRHDMCIEEHLRLSKEKRAKIGRGIVSFEYDPRKSEFYEAF